MVGFITLLSWCAHHDIADEAPASFSCMDIIESVLALSLVRGLKRVYYSKSGCGTHTYSGAQPCCLLRRGVTPPVIVQLDTSVRTECLAVRTSGLSFAGTIIGIHQDTDVVSIGDFSYRSVECLPKKKHFSGVGVPSVGTYPTINDTPVDLPKHLT